MDSNGHNDDNQYDNNSQDNTQSHLEVLPPHVFSDSIGASSEPLCTDGQVVGLVFYGVQSFTSFGDFVDVVSHDSDGVVDLLEWLVRKLM